MSTLFESPFPLAPAWAACAVALGSAAVLPRLARRMGWVDAAGGEEAARKRQARPVAAVGGAAILLGILTGWVLLDLTGRGPDALVPGRALGRWLASSPGVGATLFPLGGVLAAFAVGLLDDLLPRGLRPRWKLLGQAGSGALLGAPLLVSTAVEPTAALAVVLLFALGAAVCANAINTFDNADGAATSLVGLALLGPAPMLAAPVLAFLPFNLRLGSRPRSEPAAYLGDSGSHLLGMLLLLTPAAWPVLALPLADLARLARVRSRAGSAPWVGDRRHLAHRLAAGGLARVAVAAALVAVALPSVLLGWLGVPFTLALFALALRRSPDPDGPGGPAAPARPIAAEILPERAE